MTKVRIVTDITAYLEPEVVDRHKITVLPVEIHFGDDVYTFGPGDSPMQMFEQMAAGPAKPTRATIPARAFQKTFERLNTETEEILVVLGSSLLSEAYEQAKVASQAVLGRCRIAVLDSQSASWGLGMMVKTAAEAAETGQSLDEIVRLVRGVLPHVYVVFFVDRLDYLEERDRISIAQALLGTMLRIKPLLLVEEGDIVPLEKVRTFDLALEKLASFVTEFANLRQVVILRSPLNDHNQSLIDGLLEHLDLALPDSDFPVINYDPILACHLGPEALGVVVYEEA
jgi:DegV family protein with EDD domain